MEAGCPHSILTPSGTLTFNAPSGNRLLLQSVGGADGATVRRDVSSLSGRDGGLVPDGYGDVLYPAFTGILVAETGVGPQFLDQRETMRGQIRAYLYSIQRADGTWFWTPTGQTQRQRTVRLSTPPEIVQADRIDNFTFSLAAADPLAYSSTQTTSSDISCNGAAVAVVNSGDAASYPVLRINGAVTNPTVTNNTTGLSVVFNGLVIANGTFVDVDCRLGRCTLSTDSSSKASGLNRATTNFWSLSPGTNNVQFTGTSPSGGVKVNVIYRSAWAG